MDATIATLPPGPTGLPLLGNTVPLINDPLRFFRELEKTYGSMATIMSSPQPLVICFRPEHVRYFLIEQAQNFKKPVAGEAAGLKQFLGDGLLTIDGDFHRQQRRLVQPAFHRHRVDNYADTMIQFTQEMVAGWQVGTVVDMAQEIQRLTLRIILKTLFNIDSHAEAARLGRAFTDVIDAPRPAVSVFERLRCINLPFTAYGKSVQGEQLIKTFVARLIQERRASGGDVGDVLSMLLAADDKGITMSDQQIHDHVLTFVAAGHETAQNTLSWTFYLLSQHPDIYSKLKAELQTVLAGRTPTLADLPNLPYLEGVVNESWRIYPPAWRMGREAIADFTLDGHHFPAGTIVLLSQWVTHNLADIWGDPEVFRPERWYAEQPKPPQGAYFPFGLGTHTCIGMPFAQLEARLLLATILQSYTPRLEPGFRVTIQPRITMRPQHGLRMVLESASTA
ncbi:cytochrome P450 [Dictyobacter kobayashii]|uniref:Cytochrome P450 n=1 Tax=Dictyobacter kobayashii TaxID=2014872 RepID=A0A402AWQ5_9CHLR|nr:cytochrome P450 [Dictyobacter kobayashii]GCE23525.1 cytochrome P450 [Dictyobacter kobayashii]